MDITFRISEKFVRFVLTLRLTRLQVIAVMVRIRSCRSHTYLFMVVCGGRGVGVHGGVGCVGGDELLDKRSKVCIPYLNTRHVTITSHSPFVKHPLFCCYSIYCSYSQTSHSLFYLGYIVCTLRLPCCC